MLHVPRPITRSRPPKLYRNTQLRAPPGATCKAKPPPFDEIDVDDVKAVLQPIWRELPETSRRVRGRLEMILAFAAAHKLRSVENPARVDVVRALLGRGNRKVKSHPAYPWRELPGFFELLSWRDDIASYCLRLLILTATRSGEARGALWPEVDLANAVWTIPPERMKADAQHRVPLSPAAIEILDHVQARRRKDYVFSFTGEPISDTALRNVLRSLGVSRERGSIHGFRSSFRDWCAENGVPDDVAEAALAHTAGDKVVAAYKRTTFFDQRREVMARWAEFLTSH